jgi:hypothetical protein
VTVGMEHLLDPIRLVAWEAFAGFNKSACQDRHQQGLGLDDKASKLRFLLPDKS